MENRNHGSEADPHLVSIMLTHQILVLLAVFTLLERGCREVWIKDGATIGIEPSDPTTKWSG